MILVDVNLLLYAYNPDSAHHAAARSWLGDTFSGGGGQVFLSWTTILAFIRIMTDSRIFVASFQESEVLDIVDSWLALPSLGILEPGERYWPILKNLVRVGQIRAALTMDAHLAALALEHGAVLATNDRDFTRFPDLKTIFPLAD